MKITFFLNLELNLDCDTFCSIYREEVKVLMLRRQHESTFGWIWLALAFIFELCFVQVYTKSFCYSSYILLRSINISTTSTYPLLGMISDQWSHQSILHFYNLIAWPWTNFSPLEGLVKWQQVEQSWGAHSL